MTTYNYYEYSLYILVVKKTTKKFPRVYQEREIRQTNVHTQQGYRIEGNYRPSLSNKKIYNNIIIKAYKSAAIKMINKNTPQGPFKAL